MPLPSINSLVTTSLGASVVTLLVLCLRPALRCWIGSRAVAWLSLVIAARLVCPLPLPAPWHAPALFAAPGSETALPWAFRVSVSATSTPATPRVTRSPRPPTSAPSGSGGNLLFVVWLAGALLAAARLGRGWLAARRWAGRTLPAELHPPLAALFHALPASLRRRVTLRLTDDLDAPTLVGVFRPQIWLPRALLENLTPAELRHVLLHELGHAHRRDLLAQWLCALACCLHWFNPLVWLLARVARTDRELACDAWVLARDAAKAETVAAYGYTLLKVVEGMGRAASRALPVVSMAAGKRHLGLRVREIRAFRPLAPWRGVAALAVTTALVAAGTLRGAASAPATTVEPTPPAAPSAPADVSPTTPTPAPPAPAHSTWPLQVEIESKFIEISKSTALRLEATVPSASPVAGVFHQLFAPAAARDPAAFTPVFRSARVLPNDFQLLVRQLNEAKGVDLLSAPRVTTKSGQKATLEIIREFIYPTAFQRDKGPFDKPVTTPTNFDKKNTGAALEVTPTIEPDGQVIDLSFTWTLTSFEGFVDAEGKPVSADETKVPAKMPGAQFPVFDTHTFSTVATLTPGETIVFGRDEEHRFARRSLRFALGEAGQKDAPEKDEDRLLLVFVTATLVDPYAGAPGHGGGHGRHLSPTAAPGIYNADPTPTQPPGSPASLPYGVAVPDKPGFAVSPFAPDAGQVDLRGFTRGQEVRDPYTGELFLVP